MSTAATPQMSTSELQKLLKDQFGHESFRPGQEQIIQSLLAGRDVLAVLSTGAGKSLVFQLTAQLLPGITLVVSPLLALMKDQVESVRDCGLGVGIINSMQPQAECKADLEKAQRCENRLLYITPERLENPEFLAEIMQAQVSLLVVDEAHCVSEWGFDFRPAYLTLRAASERLGRPTLLALTATATPRIREDIVDRLGLRNPEVVVRNVDRPNLFFEVKRILSEEEEARTLRSILFDEAAEGGAEGPEPLRQAMQRSGIIYTATTRGAEETAAWLREWGIPADYYHGQRSRTEREQVQEAFMKGELRVIAATNAFGMGVDKPDIGFVIHRDIPASVEAYYQEAGRAGRDGQPARCTLIYRAAALGRAAFLSGSAHIKPEDVEKLCACIATAGEISIHDLVEQTGFGKAKLCRLLELLSDQGLVEEDGSTVRAAVNPLEAGGVSLQGEENRLAFEHSRLQMIRAYAELRDCRRRYLMNYFGQEMEESTCRFCDNDLESSPVSLHLVGDPDAAAPGFSLGQRVIHRQWGEGRVTGFSADILSVHFPEVGDKRLSPTLAFQQGILQPILDDGDNSFSTENSYPTPALSVGEHILHPVHGEGQVQHVSESSLMILFQEAGYKTLALDTLTGEQMLRNGDAPRADG